MKLDSLSLKLEKFSYANEIINITIVDNDDNETTIEKNKTKRLVHEKLNENFSHSVIAMNELNPTEWTFFEQSHSRR